MKIKVYDKPITIQFYDENINEWQDIYKLHASINKAKTDNEYIEAGAEQNRRTLSFEVRFFKKLSEVILNTSSYRIVYNNVIYDIYDVDDYMESHTIIKFLGRSNTNE